MNENINLKRILKECPEGWKFYTPICGEVEFSFIKEFLEYPITMRFEKGTLNFSEEGFYFKACEGAECLIFPSREQRDWSKFEAPWYKKDKKDRFDPQTLKAFDRVLVRAEEFQKWRATFFSHIRGDGYVHKFATSDTSYAFCIPYNDETKHLAGTKDEAPEYYRYWED